MLNSANIKFINLINVKMQTIVDILTFISMINTVTESLKQLVLRAVDMLCSVELSIKKLYNLGPTHG